MKLLSVLAAVLLFVTACRKTNEPVSVPVSSNDRKLESCDFGITHFNTVKRPTVDPGNEKRPQQPQNPPPPPSPSVILIDFDGHIVSNTVWNTNGDIVCTPANLTASEQTEVINRVSEDFRPFNVTVTTSESVYAAGNPYKRMRVIITETWQWYGQAGGVAYNNSFTWGDNTPCFVFSILLNYNVKKIAEATSHETGHTLGLRHQSVYDANCNKINEYNYGQGTGETGWAPIMGCAYNQNLTTWHYGPSTISCSSMQDDAAIIAGIVGYKTDDYSNSITSATAMAQSAEGIIHKNDVDYLSVNLTTAATLSALPFSIGNNLGADLDILLKIYNQSRVLINTINPSEQLSSSVVLNPGQYYISVEPTGNANTSVYGIMGKYNLALSAN